jgi:hypothetical protein
VLTAWAMSFVVARWTGSTAAGLIAGMLAAFNAHTLTRLPHLQAQHVEFLPLGLLALDRLLAAPRVRHGLAAGAWFALQALTSGYFLVFSVLTAVVGVAVRPSEWIGRNARRVWPALAVAAMTAAGLLLPFMIAYMRVRSEVGLVRSLPEVAKYSARWTDYLSTGSRLHFPLWSRHFFAHDALFPGVMALALTGVALVRGTAWRDRRARMCLAVALLAVALSFGPGFPPYAWLYQVVPLLQGIRGAARFGQLALVMIAAMAGFGMAEVLARVASPIRRAAVTVAVAVIVTAETLMAPLWFFEYPGIPPIYDTLARLPRAVLVHVPMFDATFVHNNTGYMLASTRHWHPMLNGYSGFIPPSFSIHMTELAGFPDERSLHYLRAIGVTHIVVDKSALGPERSEAASQNEQLQLYASDGTINIYTLVR